MKTMVKGLLLGGAISIGMILGSESVRQLLQRRHDQGVTRLARQASTLSLTLPKEGEDVQGEALNEHLVEKTETEVATQRGPVLHENTESSASSRARFSQEPLRARRANALKNILKNIPGIAPAFQVKLEAEGITTVPLLLARTATQRDCVDLASKVGTSTHLLKELVTQADLMRLKGVSAEVARLLEAAGVTSCETLQHRNAKHLHTTLIDPHVDQNIVQHPPTLNQVIAWIVEAKDVSVPTSSL